MNKKILITLCIISFFFWCSSKIAESEIYLSIKPIQTNFINFCLILCVAVTGYFGIPASFQWVRTIWVFIYVIVIAVLVVLVVINRYLELNSISVHFFSNDVKFLFTSPMPYGILIVITQMQKAR